MADLSTYEGRQAARDAGNWVGTNDSGQIVSEPGHPGGQANAGVGTGGGGGGGGGGGSSDLSGYVAAMQASSGFSIKQLDEQKREFDATLEWQKQQWQQQGLPELAIKQRTADLEDAKFGELQRAAKVSEGLAQQAQDLDKQVKLGNLTIAQAQESLQEYVQKGQLAVSQGQLGVAQGQLGLDTLKTAASLSGPENWIQASNFTRGVQNSNLPGFMQQLLSGQSTATLGGPQPGMQMSQPLTMTGMAGAMGGMPGQQGGLQPGQLDQQRQAMLQAQQAYGQQQAAQNGGVMPAQPQLMSDMRWTGGPAAPGAPQWAQQTPEQMAQMQAQLAQMQAQKQAQLAGQQPQAAAGGNPAYDLAAQQAQLQGQQAAAAAYQPLQQLGGFDAGNAPMFAQNNAMQQYGVQPQSQDGQSGQTGWTGATTADVARLFGRADPYGSQQQGSTGFGADTTASQNAMRRIFSQGGQSFGPQQLEGLTASEKKMFEGGGAAVGADVAGFEEQYQRSRIGQQAAKPQTFSGM